MLLNQLIKAQMLGLCHVLLPAMTLLPCPYCLLSPACDTGSCMACFRHSPLATPPSSTLLQAIMDFAHVAKQRKSFSDAKS